MKLPSNSTYCVTQKALFTKLSRLTLNFITEDDVPIILMGYNAQNVNKSLEKLYSYVKYVPLISFNFCSCSVNILDQKVLKFYTNNRKIITGVLKNVFT